MHPRNVPANVPVNMPTRAMAFRASNRNTWWSGRWSDQGDLGPAAGALFFFSEQVAGGRS